MSDEKLRELERRFRETGSAEDELAWLRERARSGEKLDWDSYSRLHELDVEAAADFLRWRVEAGELSSSNLELAAYCGHRAAALERSDGPELLQEDPEALVEWVRGLAPWGDVTVVFTGIAAAAFVLPHFTHLQSDDKSCDNALRRAQEWCENPSEENRDRAEEAYLAAAQAANNFKARHAGGGLLPGNPSYLDHRLALYAAWAAAYAAAAAAGGVLPHLNTLTAAATSVSRAAALPGHEVGRPTADCEGILRTMKEALIHRSLSVQP